MHIRIRRVSSLRIGPLGTGALCLCPKAQRSAEQWDKPPTLLELSRHFTETRNELLGGVLQSLSETLYAELLEQKQCHCPNCARRLNRKRMDRKRYNTLQGPATLEPPYFYLP